MKQKSLSLTKSSETVSFKLCVDCHCGTYNIKGVVYSTSTNIDISYQIVNLLRISFKMENIAFMNITAFCMIKSMSFQDSLHTIDFMVQVLE